MIRALFLIFDPPSTWDKIVQSGRGIGFVLGTKLIPLLLMGAAAEGFRLWNSGFKYRFQPERHFSLHEAVAYGALTVGVYLIAMLLAAKTIKALGETFHSRHTYAQAFTVVVYGLSPLFLLRLGALIPMPIDATTIGVTFGIGILFSVITLYHGVPRVMVPDPAHAFGLYVITSLLLAAFSAALAISSYAYLSRVDGALP